MQRPEHCGSLMAAGLAGGLIGADEARGIAADAVQAQAILTEHFHKEENVLFPMAERMLSGQEKDALAGALGVG